LVLASLRRRTASLMATVEVPTGRAFEARSAA
jgi:hypothetical protein